MEGLAPERQEEIDFKIGLLNRVANNDPPLSFPHSSQADRGGFRQTAWLLIKYRMDKGLSQAKLAELVGTSNSQISWIESGRHHANLDTLSRIAHALDLRMVLGFESTTPCGRAKRDLVAFYSKSSSSHGERQAPQRRLAIFYRIFYRMARHEDPLAIAARDRGLHGLRPR